MFVYVNIEVGKTCLIWRFSSNKFSARTMNTIGIDFKTKYVKIDNVRVKLQVSYYEVLVFSVSS
jgi:GTPase SAR1 family protein